MKIFIPALAILMLALTACYNSSEKGDLINDTVIVALDEVPDYIPDSVETDTSCISSESVSEIKTRIEMGVGSLKLSGGSSNVMDAVFSYNVKQWKPRVSFVEEDDMGILIVKQPEGSSLNSFKDVKYDWDLALNDSLPTELLVVMGVGESSLKLDNLNLKELDIETGVGETMIDLSGDYTNDVDVDIDGGVGEITVILPVETGVRVKVDGGIGKSKIYGLKKKDGYLINPAYNKSENTLFIHVETGVGEVILKTKK